MIEKTKEEILYEKTVYKLYFIINSLSFLLAKFINIS